MALYIIALEFAPLSLVQAVSAGGVGLLALLVRVGGSRLSGRECAAVSSALGGLLLLALSLPAGARSAPQTCGPPLAWVLASMVLAGVAAVPAAKHMRPGAGLAVAAGLLYPAGDVATKAAGGGTAPVPLFAVLQPVCHGLAFVSIQLSFQRGGTLATAGVSTLLTNMLPVLAGLSVYHEHMPAGPADVARGLGFAGAVLAATLLTGRDTRQEAVTDGAAPARQGGQKTRR